MDADGNGGMEMRDETFLVIPYPCSSVFIRG